MNTISVGNEQLFTPKQIAEAGIMGLVAQWEARKAGRLKFYRVAGSKILYSQKHISDYLASCEQSGQTNQTEDTGVLAHG